MTRRKLLQDQRRAQRTRLRKTRLFLESLEDRTLLSGGQWLVDITNLGGDTRQFQMAAAQQLFQQDGVDPNLQVVNHLGADGVLLVQAPTNYTQQMVGQGLAPITHGATAGTYHAVIDVEAYDPNQDPGSYNVVFPPPPDDGPGSGLGTPPGGSSTPPGPFIGPSGPGGPNGPGGPDVGSINGFKGIDSPHSFCGCSPPDTDGAVGPKSFVQHVNTSIALFDKSGNLLPGTSITSDATFYASIHKSGDSFSDPTTVYDEFTGKFVTTELEFNFSNHMFLDVATSTSSNPTTLTSADWTFAQYNTNDGVGNDFSDYPKVGYNADGLVYSFNMFPGAAFFDHVSTISIRNDGSSPGIHITPGGFNNFTLAPATMHSSSSGDPMWFVQDGHGSGGGSTVTVVEETDPFGAQSFTFTPLAVTSYGNAPNPRQPGGSLGGRTSLGTRFYFSDLRTFGGVTHLVSADTVGANGGAQARWYDFNVNSTPTLVQQGSIDQGAGVDTFFPSIAIAPNGSYGMTFSESSNTEDLSMYVTGRQASDPLGTMQTPILVKAGTGFLNAFGRAGDDSATTVDPTDGTFWATNEWADGSLGSPNWSTWIDHFTVGVSPPPPPPSPGAITGRVFNDPLHNGADNPSNPGLPGWLVYIDANHDGQFDDGDPFQITDASGNYSFTKLVPGPYTIGEVLLANYVESAPPPPGLRNVTVLSGQTTKNVDFGDYQTSAQVLIDDADTTNFQTNGGDWGPDPRGFNGGSQTNAVTTNPAENAQWTVTTGKGNFELFATWANDPTFASNATYEIHDGGPGGALLGVVTENQKIAPTQANVNGGFWNRLGTFTTSTGTFTIQLDTNGANGAVDADAVFAAKAPAGGNLITNGGFEANGGSFAGWTHVNEAGGSGDWFIQSGTTSPISGFAVPAPPGPTHAAMTDTTGPGSHVLYQDVTIPTDITGGTLSFDRFVGNRNGAFFTPASLDKNLFPNQQARVDIIKTSANVFSVAASDVLMNIYQTKVGDPAVSGYTAQSNDLSSFLVAHAGQTVRLRFAEVDNQFFFQFGIDDVALNITESSVASGPAVSSGFGTAGPNAAPSTAASTSNTSNAPANMVAANAPTPPSVSPIDNLFMAMGIGVPINPTPAPIEPSNGNTPTITGAAFNSYMTSLSSTSASNTDLVPGDGGDGEASSQDQLL